MSRLALPLERLRHLARSPKYCAAVILVLSLGVGAGTTLIAVLDTVFLRPPSAVARPQELHRLVVTQRAPDGTRYASDYFSAFSLTTFLREQTAQLAAYDLALHRRIGDGGSFGNVAFVSANFFTVLGAPLTRGRTFSDDEGDFREAHRVVIISASQARRLFGDAASALGSTLRIDGMSYLVIGVAHDSFTGIDLDATDAWVPLGCRPIGNEGPWYAEPGAFTLRLLIRLSAGSTSDALSHNLTTSFRAAHGAFEWFDLSASISLGPIQMALTGVRGAELSERNLVLVRRLGLAAGLLLLLTVTNVLALVLYRSLHHSYDAQVMMALGAPFGHILVLPTLDLLILGTAASAIASWFCMTSSRLVRTAIFTRTAWRIDDVDSRGGLLAAATVLLIVLICIVVQSGLSYRQWTRPSFAPSHVRAGATRVLLSKYLLAAQSTVSVALLVFAVSLLSSLVRMSLVDDGFAADSLISVRASGLRIPPEQIARFIREARLGEGVIAVAASNTDIRPGSTMASAKSLMGNALATTPFVDVAQVSYTYPSTAGMRIIEGRTFTIADSVSRSEVALINSTLAAGLKDRASAIGTCIALQGQACVRVVGVVADVNWDRSVVSVPQVMVLAHPGDRAGALTQIIVRTRGPATDSQARGLESLLRSVMTSSTALPRVQRISERLVPVRRPWEVAALIFVSLGVLASISTAIGSIGIISYDTDARGREIAIRLALGASPQRVLGWLLSRTLWPVLAGTAFGIAIALAFRHLLTGLTLSGVSLSGGLLALAAAVTLLASLSAALPAALRAAHSSPAALLVD